MLVAEIALLQRQATAVQVQLLVETPVDDAAPLPQGVVEVGRAVGWSALERGMRSAFKVSGTSFYRGGGFTFDSLPTYEVKDGIITVRLPQVGRIVPATTVR